MRGKDDIMKSLEALKTIGLAVFANLLLLFFSSGQVIHAREAGMRFEQAFNLKLELNGAFLRDKDGLLWIGSASGPLRYDA